MSVIDLPRVRRARAELDRLLAEYPRLRGAADRFAELVDVATVAEVDVQELVDVAATVAQDSRSAR